MRTKKTLMNSIFSIILQLVTIVCGFILPRLILSGYGSKYNGICSSITQFISYVVLMRAGIGGVTRAALYKPLLEKNDIKINGIVNATQKFMEKVSILYIIALVVFAAIYPFIIKEDFDWLFTFLLVLIMGAGNFAQNYFGITYSLILEANQEQYIYSIISLISTILNTLLASLLIVNGYSIHIVKLASAFVFVLNPIVLNRYVNKRYSIDKTVPPDNSAIKERWNALTQQVAAFVNTNTDIMVLTIFTSLYEVSVYTVYNMVLSGLNGFQNAISGSFEAAFGSILAQDKKELLDSNFRICEFVVFTIASFLFIASGFLILPFVKVYTLGITDVEYQRPLFAVLGCICGYLNGVRMPYVMLVSARGNFREIRKGAIITPIINIVISTILINRIGISGVIIGTICAMIFMIIQYGTYSSKHILKRSYIFILRHFAITSLELLSVLAVVHFIELPDSSGYLGWANKAIIISVIVFVVISFYSYIFYRYELESLMKKMKNICR